MDHPYTEGDRVTNRYTGQEAIVTLAYMHDGQPAVDVHYTSTGYDLSGYASAFFPLGDDTDAPGLAAEALDIISSIITQVEALAGVGAMYSYTYNDLMPTLRRMRRTIFTRTTNPSDTDFRSNPDQA